MTNGLRDGNLAEGLDSLLNDNKQLNFRCFRFHNINSESLVVCLSDLTV